MYLELKINPEYKALMPELPEDEFESLKNSIQKHGYWEEYPIIVNDKYEILDGHTRYKACKELGIEPTIKVKHFESKEDEMEFVIETNLSRRHLKPFQKAELALKLIEIEKVKGEARRKAKLTQHAKSVLVGPKEGPTERTWAKIAEKVGVSKDTLSKAKEILEKGDEELIEKCRKGEVSVAEAYRKVKEKEQKVSIVRDKDIFASTIIEFLRKEEDLEGLSSKIKEVHSFLDRILSSGILQNKGLKVYVSNLEKVLDFLGRIGNYCFIVLKEKEREKGETKE